MACGAQPNSAARLTDDDSAALFDGDDAAQYPSLAQAFEAQAQGDVPGMIEAVLRAMELAFTTSSEGPGWAFMQDSAAIYVTYDRAWKTIAVESPLMRVPRRQRVPLMRTLLQMTEMTLGIARFCLRDDIVVLRFADVVTNTSPPKLRRAVEEVAVLANRYDDPLALTFRGEMLGRHAEANRFARSVLGTPRRIPLLGQAIWDSASRPDGSQASNPNPGRARPTPPARPTTREIDERGSGTYQQQPPEVEPLPPLSGGPSVTIAASPRPSSTDRGEPLEIEDDAPVDPLDEASTGETLARDPGEAPMRRHSTSEYGLAEVDPEPQTSSSAMRLDDDGGPPPVPESSVPEPSDDEWPISSPAAERPSLERSTPNLADAELELELPTSRWDHPNAALPNADEARLELCQALEMVLGLASAILHFPAADRALTHRAILYHLHARFGVVLPEAVGSVMQAIGKPPLEGVPEAKRGIMGRTKPLEPVMQPLLLVPEHLSGLAQRGGKPSQPAALPSLKPISAGIDVRAHVHRVLQNLDAALQRFEPMRHMVALGLLGELNVRASLSARVRTDITDLLERFDGQAPSKIAADEMLVYLRELAG